MSMPVSVPIGTEIQDFVGADRYGERDRRRRPVDDRAETRRTRWM